MIGMHRRAIAAIALAGSLGLGSGIALANHDPDLSADEVKCQLGTSLAVSKFITDKAKCLTKCEQGARKTPPLNPSSDCQPPYAGPTGDCVARAESKATGLEQSKCAKDCPECYMNADCAADASARIADTESNVDTLRLLVYCDDSGSGDGLTKAEAKCADTVAKTLANFAKAKLLCFSKCRKDEDKLKVPVGSCDPPPSDQKTSDCIQKATDKATAAIDKQCESSVNSKADKPDCYTLTSAQWANAVEMAVDDGQANLYCGSPSAAFVD